MSEEKKQKIKEILPLLWNSYEHMYEARESNIKNSINFLLVVVSFLPATCLTLYELFSSSLFLIPIIFQLMAFFVLLKSFFVKTEIPWLETKETLSHLKNGTFEIDLFATLKAAESGTYAYLQKMRDLIKRAIFLLTFSIFLILLACLFISFNGNTLLYVMTLSALILFLLLYLFFYKEAQVSNFKSEYKNILENVTNWIEDEKT